MSRTGFRNWVIALLALFAANSTAHAQSSELSQAVLALPSTFAFDQRLIAGARLFGGAITATITNVDGTAQDFRDLDRISFQISPRVPTALSPTGQGFNTPFIGTRGEFEAWAQGHAQELLSVLFPGSLSSGLSGRDTAQFYSQQFLLTTALATDSARQSGPRDRASVGGLVEYEVLGRIGRNDNDSGRALQGLYQFGRTLSVQGRLAQQRESLSTRTTNLAVDYHPFVEITRAEAVWRVGATARSGLLYATSDGPGLQDDVFRIGSVDLAGGGWVSVFKDLGVIRVGGGSLFQGTKSHVPAGEDGTFRAAFAQALNERGIAYDVTYGGSAGFDTSARTAVIAKYLESRAVGSDDERPTSRIGLVGLSYRFGLPSVSVGYRVHTTLGLRAHSVFFQGNFDW